MYAYKFLIKVGIPFLLLNHMVIGDVCKRKEDCSQQIEDGACSFCIGESKKAKCYFPFPEIYTISKTSGNLCIMNDANLCNKENPCKNGGECLPRQEELYVCKCEPYYVGKNCEIKYNKMGLYFLFDVDFPISVTIYSFINIEVYISLLKDRANKVTGQVLDLSEYGYSSYLKNKWGTKHCRSGSCSLSYHGKLFYSYKPYNKSDEFLFLGKNVLGYFTKFQINIFHENTPIYKRDFRVFVKYPENNICLPFAQLGKWGNCGSFDKATVYYRWSNIRIISSLEIITDGNSRYPSKDNKNRCKSISEITLLWKVYRITMEWSEILVKERVKDTDLTFSPFELDFGLYRVGLEAQNIFSKGYKRTHAVCYFEITSYSLEAIIDGGMNRQVTKNEGLLLSSLKSRDPNQFSGQQSIMVKWSCSALNSSEVDVSVICKSVTKPNTEPHYIPPNVLGEGEFNFTLEIWSDLYTKETCKQSKLAKRHQFSYQIVVVTMKKNLWIVCEHNCRKKVIINEELILKVSNSDNADKVAYRWSLIKVENHEEIILKQLGNLPSYIFYVEEDTLETASKYIVSVTLDSKNVSSIYSFETDTLHYSGNCSVVPESGICGITEFNISCSISKSDQIYFEFYDKTSKEAGGNTNVRLRMLSGRMLGSSHTGELQSVKLTRGTLVIYIIHSLYWYHVNKTYVIKLSQGIFESHTLMDKVVRTLHSLQDGSPSFIMQYISHIPDIVTKEMNQKSFLDLLLQNIKLDTIKDINDVKISTLTLYNVLKSLGIGNMDARKIQLARRLINWISEVFVNNVYNNIIETVNRKEAKEIVQIILNILELSLENEIDFYGIGDSLNTMAVLNWAIFNIQLEQILDDSKKVLSALQMAGLPPTTIYSINNTFVFKVLEEDKRYNFNLLEMLQTYSDIPVFFSSDLIKHLILKPEDNLSLTIATINKNIFKMFDQNTVSNLLSISLNKRTMTNKIVKAEALNSPVDMLMYFNESLAEVNEVSQTFSLDPASDKNIPDLQIRVYRFDPDPGGLLSVTFLYPPTDASLRVLIVKDYRPTYEMMMSDAIVVTERSPYYTPNYTKTDSKVFHYMGILPGPGIPLNQSVKFSFTFNSTVCRTWERLKWASTGCSVGPNTTGSRIHCRCNHLSIFGAIFPFIPIQVDPFSDAKLFLTVLDNPLVVILMFLLFILYIIVCIWAYYEDKKDLFSGYITFLEDNFPDDKYPYLLAVYTNSYIFAGTSANVGVQLIGSLGSSRAHILESKFYKVLKRRSDDWFLMLCPKPLGLIQYLHIWHDNSGFSPDWYCNKVHVFDINSQLEVIFLVEQWIELNLTIFPEALIVPATTDDILDINRVMSNNISESLRNQRFLAGIFAQHPRSTERRIQRINIFMCVLLFALLWSIMFYTVPNKPTPDEYEYNLNERDLYISFFTIAVSVLVEFCINLLFKKSYKFILEKNPTLLCLRHDLIFDEYCQSRKQSDFNYFIPKSEKEDSIVKTKNFRKEFAKVVKKITTNQQLAPSVLPNGSSSIIVQKGWLALAWTTCAIIIIICTYLIMLFGLKMGSVKSKKWLTSVLFSYVENTVAINPLTILVLAGLLTSTSIGFTSSNYRVTCDEIRQSINKGNVEIYEVLTKKRQHPMYLPMKDVDKKQMLKKKLKLFHRMQGLRLFCSLCYIVLVFTIINKLSDLDFSSTAHLHKIFTSDQTSNYGFYNGNDIVHFSGYFEKHFIKTMYTYCNSSKDYWTSDYSWKLIGQPYIRQLRVKPVPCHSVAQTTNSCIPHWSSQTEDTDPYGIMWSTSNFPHAKKDLEDSVWEYNHPTASWVNTMYRLTGKSGKIYNNGGYEDGIGSFALDTVATLTSITDLKWIDRFSKVVFIETILYNVNLQRITKITLIMEFLTTGLSIKGANIRSVAPCRKDMYKYWLKSFFFILIFTFLLDIIYNINYRGFIMFFKEIKNIVLLGILILSITILILYYIQIYECLKSDLMKRFYDNDYDYLDFDQIIIYYKNINSLLIFILLISVCRTLLLMQGQRTFLIAFRMCKLSLKVIFFLLPLTYISFIILWKIYLHSDISSSNSMNDLVISQKSTKHNITSIQQSTFDSVLLSFIKFYTLMFISGLFITIFVHHSRTAHSLVRKSTKTVLHNNRR